MAKKKNEFEYLELENGQKIKMVGGTHTISLTLEARRVLTVVNAKFRKNGWGKQPVSNLLCIMLIYYAKDYEPREISEAVTLYRERGVTSEKFAELEGEDGFLEFEGEKLKIIGGQHGVDLTRTAREILTRIIVRFREKGYGKLNVSEALDILLSKYALAFEPPTPKIANY